MYNGKLYSFNATIGNNTLEGEVTVYVKSSILSLQYNNEYNMWNGMWISSKEGM